MNKQALGKGLSALIPVDDTAAASQGQYRHVVLDQIAPNPMQPRQTFDSESLAELTASISQNGIVQPLVLRKNGAGYTIIAGERRYRAARLAGLEKVPAVIMDDVDDARLLELALVENIHREDLNALELAEAYHRLMEQCGLTQNEMATRVGRSRAAVANHLRLLSLPDPIKRLLAERKLSEGHARAILALESQEQMLAMATRIVNDSLSVRQVERVSGGRSKRRRLVPKRRSPAIAEIEVSLKRMLTTSVKISPGLKRGKIEIEYYGEDDLDRLWQLLRRIES